MLRKRKKEKRKKTPSIEALYRKQKKLYRAAVKNNVEEVTRLLVPRQKRILLLLDSLEESPNASVQMKTIFSNTFVRSTILSFLEPDITDINFKDGFTGSTMLYSCADRGNLQVIKVLLRERNLDLNCPVFHKKTALHRAVVRNRIRVVEALLKDSRVDVNARDAFEGTPLIDGALSGSEEAVRLLLQHPNINPTIKNNEGKTAAQMASRHWHPTIARLVTNAIHGAPPPNLERTRVENIRHSIETFDIGCCIG